MEGMKRIDRILKYRGAIVDMYEDLMESPNGKIAHWDYIEHRKGAAAVVAVRDDGKLVMVRQYRNALDRETLELPAGARDSVTEDTAICAARELEEETGYKAGKLELLIRVASTVAFCNEMVDVYLATELIKTSQQLDEEEFLNVEFYSLEELKEMIYAGKLQDAKTIAAVMAYNGLLT